MNAAIPALLSTPPSADIDPEETAEWRDAFARWCSATGRRARASCWTRWHAPGGSPGSRLNTPYVNTVAPSSSRRSRATWRSRSGWRRIMRWNALAMVVRANQAHGELGGHIASYASAADLFEVGFNHFFRAAQRAARRRPGVLPAAQAPGVYARAFLEGPAERSRPGALPAGDRRAQRGARACRATRTPG
jgi:pyruvate dehydrogenase E1 component